MDDKVDMVVHTPEVVTLIYHITITSPGKNKKTETNKILASSTYALRAGKWRNTLYQEISVK